MNLREERLNRGLTVAAAALDIGVHRGTLAALERGETVNPANAKKVADYFGVRVTDLMPVDPEPKTAA